MMCFNDHSVSLAPPKNTANLTKADSTPPQMVRLARSDFGQKAGQLALALFHDDGSYYSVTRRNGNGDEKQQMLKHLSIAIFSCKSICTLLTLYC